MKPILFVPILALAACTTDSPDPEVVGQKMVDLQKKFDVIDTDSDGFLTKAEIVAGYDELGVVNRSPGMADEIIDFYDFDKDGRISLREAQSGAVTGPEKLIEEIEEGAG